MPVFSLVLWWDLSGLGRSFLGRGVVWCNEFLQCLRFVVFWYVVSAATSAHAQFWPLGSFSANAFFWRQDMDHASNINLTPGAFFNIIEF